MKHVSVVSAMNLATLISTSVLRCVSVCPAFAVTILMLAFLQTVIHRRPTTAATTQNLKLQVSKVHDQSTGHFGRGNRATLPQGFFGLRICINRIFGQKHRRELGRCLRLSCTRGYIAQWVAVLYVRYSCKGYLGTVRNLAACRKSTGTCMTRGLCLNYTNEMFRYLSRG